MPQCTHCILYIATLSMHTLHLLHTASPIHISMHTEFPMHTLGACAASPTHYIPYTHAALPINTLGAHIYIPLYTLIAVWPLHSAARIDCSPYTLQTPLCSTSMLPRLTAPTLRHPQGHECSLATLCWEHLSPPGPPEG